MGAPMVLSRGNSPSSRVVLVAAATLLLLLGLIYHVDVLPDRSFFTSSTPDAMNQRPLQGEKLPGMQPHGKEGAEEDETPKLWPATNCSSGLDYLKQLGLTRSIKYSRRCIKPVYLDGADRDAVANISAPLITGHTLIANVNAACIDAVQHAACDTLELPVPRPYPKAEGQYGHLLFAVATSYERLSGSRPTFAHWLAGTGATLIGSITDGPEEAPGQLDLAALAADYRAAGVDLELASAAPRGMSASPQQGHVMVIADMLGHIRHARASDVAGDDGGEDDETGSKKKKKKKKKKKEAEWLGILDDDTFFPAIEPLSAALAAYDHTVPQYLGALTESAGLVPQGVLGGFGGAGIFVSVPLALEMEPHLDGCLLSSGGGVGGDMQIMECIHEHSRARLQRVEGLFQQDMLGDLSGFFESGRRVLSLHHWKSWYRAPVADMARVAGVCGGCFLQRWRFEGGVVLSNGYSIAVYPDGGVPDLRLTELTWGGWDGSDVGKDYGWSLGPFRPPREDKKLYKLEMALDDDDDDYDDGGEEGGLRQVYVKRGDGGEEEVDGEVDEVVELVWES